MMKTRNLLPLILMAATIAVGACGSDSPTAPRLSVAPDAGLTPAEKLAQEALKDSLKALHEALIARRDSVRDAQKSRKDAQKDGLKALQADWKTYKSWWNDFRKDNKGAVVSLLRCEPLEYAADAEVIGPDGGTLHVGPHKLVVPKGAVQKEVLMVAEAPMGSLVQVKFGPHGQHFDVPATLTLSYSHCMRPDRYTYRVVYTDDDVKRILEFPPSADSKTLKEVSAAIDHFSSYIVAF